MNQKNIKKILASMILITIAFANISFLGEVFAANENLENQSTLTNNASVNFDAYFKDENGNKIHSIKADIDEELILYVYGIVAEGYQKHILVTINNANFIIVEDKITYGDIEDVNGNVVTINRIRRDEELEVAIPIKSIKDDEISADLFNKQSEIAMNAILVKNNSKLKKISKTINTIVEWTGKPEAVITQEVIKYVPFEKEDSKGVILQTIIKTGLKDNILPIKSTEITVEIPKINNNLPKEINVSSNTTIATNGKDGLEFNISNYEININNIIIKVENNINDNKITWKKNCLDEYVVTYIYDENTYEEIKEASAEIKLEANTKIEAYNNEKTIIEKEEVIEKELQETINDIVITTLNSSNIINKGYMYTGFETEYNEKLTIDIANNKLANSIMVKESEDKFETETEKYNVNSKFKSTKINKTNFKNILGNDGYFKIYNQDDNLVATINKDTEVDENNNYIVNYDTQIKSLKYEISNIKSIGKIIIENTKIIPTLEKAKKKLKHLKK